MQLKMDFNPKQIPSDFGKKLERIPVSCSVEFKRLFKIFVELTKSDSDSELGFRYLIEGMQKDLGTIFINNPEVIGMLSQYLKKG